MVVGAPAGNAYRGESAGGDRGHDGHASLSALVEMWAGCDDWVPEHHCPRAHRAHLRSRGITAVIPEPAGQIGHRKNKGSRGGRPVAFDAHDYKNRNVVERAFNHLKNWRGLASRYDKHALVYRGGVVLASILLWLQ